MRKRQTYFKPTTTVLQMDVSHALLAGSGKINKFKIKVDDETTSSSEVKNQNPDDIDANKNSAIWDDDIWK